MFAALKSAFGVKSWPEFTRDEIAKHNTPESCWIVAGEKVFDVTPFINLHPAGPTALLKRGGGCTDCTMDFKFHSKGARGQWESFQVGVLAPGEKGKRAPACAAPDPAMLKAREQPLNFGGVSESQAVSVIKPLPQGSSPAPPEVDDDDGGEDCSAPGTCCKGGPPTDACASCPNAPRCSRHGSSKMDATAHDF